MNSAEQDISDHQLITSLHISQGFQIILHVWINALGRLFRTRSFISKGYFKLFYTRGVIWGTLKSGKKDEVRKNWDANHSTELRDLLAQTTCSCVSVTQHLTGGTVNTAETPRSTVLLEKLSVYYLAKKFPAFYGAQMFITLPNSQAPVISPYP